MYCRLITYSTCSGRTDGNKWRIFTRRMSFLLPGKFTLRPLNIHYFVLFREATLQYIALRLPAPWWGIWVVSPMRPIPWWDMWVVSPMRPIPWWDIWVVSPMRPIPWWDSATLSGPGMKWPRTNRRLKYSSPDSMHLPRNNVSKGLMYLVCLIVSFVRTDIVTTIFHEKLEQFW